jgi:hypothetical protein
MSQDDKKHIEQDLFIANSIYPEGEAVFAFHPKPLKEIKDDCYIVFDTNALLVPYTTSKESLEQIRKTCKPLVKSKRVIIPGQVAREFAKHRANKITELHQQLSAKRDSISALKKGPYPLLESLESYKKSLQLEDKINKLLNEYRDVIGKVLDHIQGWTWNDPVSQLYRELFSKDAVVDIDFDREEVRGDLANRKLHSIPPGYKDVGVGDLLIWRTILSIGSEHKKSVIFISGDEKADWYHQSNKQALYPRYELVDEFRRHSEGQSFHIVRFSAFLNLYGASDEIVEEVRKEELQISSLAKESGFRGEILVAQQAIRAWLKQVYPNTVVLNVKGEFSRYTVHTRDGAPITVDVLYFHDAHIFIRNYKKDIMRGHILPAIDTTGKCHWVFVGVNEKDGYALAVEVGLVRDQNPQIEITVGYITPDGEFSASIPIYRLKTR